MLNLLDEASNSRFVTRKWNIVNDQSNANYDVRNEIIYNTEVLKCNLCDWNDAYIMVKGNITIAGDRRAEVPFKNCAPFIKCISKIDGTTKDDAEYLDLVISMYNLLEYDLNYSETTGSLSFYSKVEGTNFNANIKDNNNFKSFKYEA